VLGGLKVVSERPESHDAGSHDAARFGQVLRFRRRRPDRPPLPSAAASPAQAEPADDLARDDLARYDLARYDLARHEQEQDEPIDYRQRMLMNVIAIAIVTVLVGAGVWIADTIAAMQNDQDCVLQGRGNCAPIEAPLPNRQ
jgi:hypothetical protein